MRFNVLNVLTIIHYKIMHLVKFVYKNVKQMKFLKMVFILIYLLFKIIYFAILNKRFMYLMSILL